MEATMLEELTIHYDAENGSRVVRVTFELPAELMQRLCWWLAAVGIQRA
jgi:hypothetical protein